MRYRLLPSPPVHIPSPPAPSGWPPRRKRCRHERSLPWESSRRLGDWRKIALHLLGFRDGLVDPADHVEGLFRKMIVLAVDDGLEGRNGVLQRHVLTGRTGEDLRHEEGLGEEALNFARSGDSQLVFVGQLVHAQDGNDVLELLVALEGALDRARRLVVLLTDHVGIEDTAGGVQRIHGRVDAQLRDLPRQHQGGVEVGEGGGRRRVGEVVRGHIDRLEGGNGAGPRRGDALLQQAHFQGQGGLVAHGRGHAPEQRGDLGAGKGVTVDVVDEHQDIAALVAEKLGHGQAGQSHPGPVARGLVHLAVDQGHLVEDVGLRHLMVEVVPLAGPFADAREHRITGVLYGDVTDQFHQGNRLADAGAAEQAHLATLDDGHDEVDDLDARLQNLGGGRLVLEFGRDPVDGPPRLGFHRPLLVDGLAQDVHDAAQGGGADRDLDGRAGARGNQTTPHTVGGTHGDGAHDAVAELLLYLERQTDLIDFQGVVDLRHLVAGELYVHHGTDDLHHVTRAHSLSSCRLAASRYMFRRFSSTASNPIPIKPRPPRRRSRKSPG